MIFQNFKNLIKKSNKNNTSSNNKSHKKSPSNVSATDHSRFPKYNVVHSETVPSSQESSLDNPHGSGSQQLSGKDESKENSVDFSETRHEQTQVDDVIDNNTHTDGIQPYAELQGKYTLIEQIGEGAFSTVHKAVDILNGGRFVAIKIISKTRINDAQADGILKEISIMKKLNHKNIVKLYNAIESRDNFFLVLEYCAGGEIFKQIINFTYFSEDLSRHIIVQVANAIKYLHEEIGVAHRDIKPENLLFVPCEYRPRPQTEFFKSKRQSDGDEKIDEGYFIKDIGGGGIGIVKLADFGLSKVLWNTTTQTPCGTAGYTAPEIVKVEKYSKSVDLWAIGCVLYTLLCGFPPFFDDNNDQAKLLDKNLKGEYEFLSPWWDEISVDAKKLVQNLLNVNPLKRYSIDQLLCDPWMLQGGYRQSARLKQRRNYNEKANVDYFPSYQSLVVEEEPTSGNSNNTSAKASPLTTPNRINPNNNVEDKELIQKEKRYKQIFNKNIEFERENLDYLTSHKPQKMKNKHNSNRSFDFSGTPSPLRQLDEEEPQTCHKELVVPSGPSSPSDPKVHVKNLVLRKKDVDSNSSEQSIRNYQDKSIKNQEHPIPILINKSQEQHNGNGSLPHSTISINDNSRSFDNVDNNEYSYKATDAARQGSTATAISSLTDSLNAVSFIPKRKNTLPRTPCPINLKFDGVHDTDEEQYDEEDEEEDLVEDNSSSDEEYSKTSKLKQNSIANNAKKLSVTRPSSSGDTYPPRVNNIKNNHSRMSLDSQINDTIEHSLNNFNLDLNNSSMLERRRKSNAIAPTTVTNGH